MAPHLPHSIFAAFQIYEILSLAQYEEWKRECESKIQIILSAAGILNISSETRCFSQTIEINVNIDFMHLFYEVIDTHVPATNGIVGVSVLNGSVIALLVQWPVQGKSMDNVSEHMIRTPETKL